MSNPADPSSLLSDFLALPPEGAGVTPPPPAGTVVSKPEPVVNQPAKAQEGVIPSAQALVKGEPPSEDRRLMGLTWMKDCSELVNDGPVFAPVTEGPVTSTATQLLNTPYRRDTGKTKLKPRVKGSGTSVRKGVREDNKRPEIPIAYAVYSSLKKKKETRGNSKRPEIPIAYATYSSLKKKKKVNEKIGQSLSMELGSSKATGSTARVAGVTSKHKPSGYAGARSSAMQASDSAHKSNDRDSHLFARNAHAYASMMSDDADDKKFHHHYAIQHDKLAGGRTMEDKSTPPYADLPNLICEWYDEHDAVDQMILEAELVNALQAGTRYFAALQERETPNSPRQTKLNRQSTLASNLAFNSSAAIKNRDDHEAHSRAHQLHTKAADLAAKTGNIELEKHHRGIAGAHANLAKSRQLGKEGGAAYEKWAASGKKTNRASDSTKKSLLFGGLMKVGSAIKSGARKAVDAVKKTISHDDAVKHLKSLKHTDGPVKLSFTKGNGEHREMNARFGVEHKLKGKGASYDREKAGHLTAFDEDKKGYRNIPTRNLKMVHVNGVPHEVVHDTKAKESVAEGYPNPTGHSSDALISHSEKSTNGGYVGKPEDEQEFHSAMMVAHRHFAYGNGMKDVPEARRKEHAKWYKHHNENIKSEDEMKEAVSAARRAASARGGAMSAAYKPIGPILAEISPAAREAAKNRAAKQQQPPAKPTSESVVEGREPAHFIDNDRKLYVQSVHSKPDHEDDLHTYRVTDKKEHAGKADAPGWNYQDYKHEMKGDVSKYHGEQKEKHMKMSYAAKQQQPPARPTSESVKESLEKATAIHRLVDQAFKTGKIKYPPRIVKGEYSNQHHVIGTHSDGSESLISSEQDAHSFIKMNSGAEESDATAGDKTRESALASVLPNVLTALRQSSFARDGWAITNLTPTRQDHPLVEKML